MATSLLKPRSKGEQLLQKYLTFAESLIAECHELQHITGINKLVKKCQSEIRFLNSLKTKSDDLQESGQLKSSNLSRFAGIYHAVLSLPGVCKILHPFSLSQRPESLIVDVIANQGHAWVKVIARKGQALHLIWAGQGQYGERDLVRQAEDYICCASEHPINFRIPQVHFAFYNQVTVEMAETLEKRGIMVWGQRVPVQQDIQDKLFEISASSKESDDNDGVYVDQLNEPASGSNSEQESKYLEQEKKICDIHSTSDDNFGDQDDIVCSHRVLHTGYENESCDIEQRKDKNLSTLGKCCHGNSFCVKRANHLDLEKSDRKVSSLSQETVSNDNCNCDSLVHICENSTRSAFKSSVFKTDSVSTILGAIPEFNIPLFTGSYTGSQNEAVIQKVNLDITTLITLVSSITHGRCHFDFKEPILTEQAVEERKDPVLPKLKNFLQGKELYACQTAVDDFCTILKTLGGPNEKQRAEELLQNIKIVPDQPSERTRKMPHTGKIKERTKIIFGTGDQLQAVTVSANSGFLRAAEHQGVLYAAYLHPSRALTEQKEKDATVITDKH